MPALFGDTLYCGLPDVSDKAPLNSPVFTGTPTCPTSTQTSSTNKELVNVEYLHNQGYATGTKSMPSLTSIDITTGTAPFTYTAPANGWICFELLTSSTSTAFISLVLSGAGIGSSSYTDSNNSNPRAICPIKKGQTMRFNYTGGTINICRFNYADGEV